MLSSMRQEKESQTGQHRDIGPWRFHWIPCGYFFAGWLGRIFHFYLGYHPEMFDPRRSSPIVIPAGSSTVSTVCCTVQYVDKHSVKRARTPVRSFFLIPPAPCSLRGW